jgi:hypothetical protein
VEVCLDRFYRLVAYEFRVQTIDREIGDLVDRLLGACRVGPLSEVATATYVIDVDRPNSVFHLWRDGESIGEYSEAAPLLDSFLWKISNRSLKESKGYLGVHAGVVSWNGEGLILPAPADSGKTTLTAGLIHSGFSYLSDEAALIDVATGLLHSFPRPLWMDPSTVDVLDGLSNSLPIEYHENMKYNYHLVAEDLGSSVGEPCPVQYVISPKYQKGDTNLRRIGRAEGLHLLADNAFNFDRFGADAFTLLNRVATDAEFYKLEVGDLDAAVQAVLNLVDRRLHPS